MLVSKCCLFAINGIRYFVAADALCSVETERIVRPKNARMLKAAVIIAQIETDRSIVE